MRVSNFSIIPRLAPLEDFTLESFLLAETRSCTTEKLEYAAKKAKATADPPGQRKTLVHRPISSAFSTKIKAIITDKEIHKKALLFGISI